MLTKKTLGSEVLKIDAVILADFMLTKKSVLTKKETITSNKKSSK